MLLRSYKQQQIKSGHDKHLVMIFFDIEYFEIFYIFRTHTLKRTKLWSISGHINHQYCLVHLLRKCTWVNGMFIRLDFLEEEERERESILLEVIVHIHYTAYILLFLLHNQYHHTKVSRGDRTLARERIWCDVPSLVKHQQCPLFIKWTVSSYNSITVNH